MVISKMVNISFDAPPAFFTGARNVHAGRGDRGQSYMYITMRKTISLHLRQRVPHPAPPWLIQYGARLILPSFPA